MKDIQNIPALLRVLKCFQKCKLADLESILLPTSVSQPLQQISIALTLFSLRLPLAYLTLLLTPSAEL